MNFGGSISAILCVLIDFCHIKVLCVEMDSLLEKKWQHKKLWCVRNQPGRNGWQKYYRQNPWFLIIFHLKHGIPNHWSSDGPFNLSKYNEQMHLMSYVNERVKYKCIDCVNTSPEHTQAHTRFPLDWKVFVVFLLCFAPFISIFTYIHKSIYKQFSTMS